MGELRTRNYIRRLSFSLSASHPVFWLCSQIGFYPVGARSLYLQPYPPVDWNPTERTSVSLGIPGGSVVRTPWFPCCMPRCDPGSAELRSRRPQAVWCRQNNRQSIFFPPGSPHESPLVSMALIGWCAYPWANHCGWYLQSAEAIPCILKSGKVPSKAQSLSCGWKFPPQRTVRPKLPEEGRRNAGWQKNGRVLSTREQCFR